MAGFVIEFDRRTRARRISKFHTSGEAVRYRLELEDARTNPDIEIVALISDSLATLERTHSRYFTGRANLVAP